MSNIYSAKFMHEAQATLESKVFKRPVNETYLFSTMKALREMNDVINEATKKLYIQINEAESKEDENKLFADYFYQFKAIFSEFSNKINEMKSRMIISVENKVETWEDLYKDDEYISSFDKEFSYSGYNFLHVEDANYPRLCLQKFYQREFDEIAKLMQDKNISATPNARLKIIASVYNNFAKISGDKDWIKDLIKDMVDIDDKEITRSYSECIFNALRDKYDITVDKGMLYTCKENLCDYEDIINAAVKLCDDLLCDLDKVSENICSFLFRNQDNKLKIKTDTDGIYDRDYRLDTYSMNQLDLFLKNKVSQIKKLLNVYAVAVGIKFDTALDFIDQNIDILKAAKTYTSNIPEVDETVEDTEGEESSVPEEGETESTDDPDFDDSFDNFDDFDDDLYEDDNDSDEENDDEEVSNEFMDNEEFSESYLFESQLFELEMMNDEYQTQRYIREALLLEEEEGEKDKPAGSENPNLKKIADKEDSNFFRKIVEKIKELWERFRKKFLDNTKQRVDFLKKNEDQIKKKVSGEASLKYTPKFDLIDKMTIPDLNFASIENDLDNEETFFSKHFSSFYKNGEFKSVTDAIKTTILGAEQQTKEVNSLQTSVVDAYNYCIKHESVVNKLNSMINILNRAQRVAEDLSKVEVQQNSASLEEHNKYFSEFSGDQVKAAPQKKEKLKLYFRVCSSALSAYMTVSNNLFYEMYAYCNWHINKAKGGDTSGDNK